MRRPRPLAALREHAEVLQNAIHRGTVRIARSLGVRDVLFFTGALLFATGVALIHVPGSLIALGACFLYAGR